MDYKSAAIKLWAILDDIDTLGDIVKENHDLYRKHIGKHLKKRHEIMVSDGYNLFDPETKERIDEV